MVNILKKMPDGWFYGERTNGGEGGWFPSSYVQQILNDHVRAKNYRQRLRAMQMAAGMRLQQEQSSVCNAHPRRNNYLINRFRRLSNPKVLFQSNSMDK
ncbi:hypothetical protein AB6A40_011511 [Gnathostoma spinigerum]|uniref:SH3 domain-containing protein n=1 Tax=Gnathostoma spinigerum TaxID=75299 RepID=A0ABD6F4F9_9BILA